MVSIINFLNTSCEAYTCPSYNERYDYMLCTLYIRMAASVKKMAGDKFSRGRENKSFT